MIPQLANDPDRAEDIIRELIEVCRKRGVVLMAGNGVFYMGRVQGDLRSAAAAAMMGLQPQAHAIAQIRQINPTMAEWLPSEEEKRVTKA